MLEHRQVAADFALGNAVVMPCMWPARCAITWAASGCDYGRALAGIHDLFKARGTLRDPGEALPTECTIEQKHMLAGGGGSTPSMGVCGAGAPPGTRGGSGERQPPRERMNHPKWPKRQPACVFFDRASGFAPRVKKAVGFTTPSFPPPKFQLHTSLRTHTRTYHRVSAGPRIPPLTFHLIFCFVCLGGWPPPRPPALRQGL